MIDATYVQTEGLVAADSNCMLCGAHTSRHTSCARCKRTLCWRCSRPAGGVRPYDPSAPLAIVCGKGHGCSDPEIDIDTQPSLARVTAGGLASLAERGQSLVEYALIIALVSVLVIVGIVLLAPQISSIFTGIHNGL
jgi:Flp pilus assembly pilin Flp